MKTLIAGGGEIGLRVAVYLSEHGAEVTIVDENKERCDWLSKNVDATVYNGNILDPGLLMEAGIDKTDLLLTALANDQVTVKLVDFAKSQFAVPRVIAITKSSEAVPRTKESGADSVVCSENVVLDQVEGMIQTNGHKTIYSDRQKDFEIARLSIKATSGMLGREVSKIAANDSRITAVFRGGRLIFPSDDPQLQMGDELFIMGKEGSLRKMIEDLEEG
ncbi:MAG: potassium channel family protein [Nitrososphaerales archaeon]